MDRNDLRYSERIKFNKKQVKRIVEQKNWFYNLSWVWESGIVEQKHWFYKICWFPTNIFVEKALV